MAVVSANSMDYGPHIVRTARDCTQGIQKKRLRTSGTQRWKKLERVVSMIQIGDYRIEWVMYKFRDPADGKQKEHTSLFINRPDGEGGSFNEVDFIAMLDAFWAKHF